MGINRAFVRFQKHPSSARYAAAAIVATILVLVFSGALFIQLLAPAEYPGLTDAIWFTLQTVTTVGYGDNPPTSGVGRVVASVVMLGSFGLMTVITAGITSMLIRSVTREQQQDDQRDVVESLERIETMLAAAHERLDQIERTAAVPTAAPTDD